MASSRNSPTDQPRTPSPRKAKSPVSPSGLVSIPEDKLVRIPKPYPNYKVAFIGRTGSGRNSLAWRMDNLNDSELPVLEFLPLRDVTLDAATRPALQKEGMVGLEIRMVPPEELDGEPFFDRRGGINGCDALVFVIDLGDEMSSEEFYSLHRKALRHAKPAMPPFLIVGSKVDQKNVEVAELYGWDVNAERMYSARGYLECSAKTNDGVGDVLDAILKIVL